MASYLTRLGYSVIPANDTDEAWEKVGAAPGELTVAVFDATVGGGDTTENLALRLLRANPSLGVIVTSGYPVEMAALQAGAPGRLAFLHKPFGPEHLVEAVRRMIGSQEEEIRPSEGSPGDRS
jgi:DNA-binding NtrC family response regulator